MFQHPLTNLSATKPAVYMKMLVQTPLFLLLATLFMPLGGLAIPAGGFSDIVESSSSSKGRPDIQLEASPMGSESTQYYTRILNSHLRDLGPQHAATAWPAPRGGTYVHDSVPWVHNDLLSNRENRRLMYLGMTPDNKRKVYAHVMLERGRGETPNVAIVSTPKVWNSMGAKMQLHTFAEVHSYQPSALQEAVSTHFNTGKLNSLASRFLPMDAQDRFEALVGRRPTF